ncbi:uncharacterized protein LOC120185370 [Hibiscus syriacus]|uniref:uncharacterized protein LOC120185370 n=1 Tax=Hibiscus syriacus TaxID=106335 RepID=UPI0019236891|nr:uncharacterized protein LOC120185370 [Hibiscus syriacus]
MHDRKGTVQRKKWKLKQSGSNFCCGMVNLYGPAVDSDKSLFVEELLDFLKSILIPWCIGGDFNMILELEENWNWLDKSKEGNKKSTSELEKEITSLENCIQNSSGVSSLHQRLASLKSLLWVEYRKEERAWFQKFRLWWFSEGDRNTRFFHLTASARRMKNAINCLKKDDVLITDPAAIKQHEVWEALLASNGNKALGPDGFNLGREWEQGTNHSFDTLIPKIANPEQLGDFRPIILVGSLYKILSKVLTKRLKPCIDQIIGDSQFAFIAGHQILYCSLVANETIDYVSKAGISGIAFKIDFHKAYYTVNWEFLLQIMRKCGFGEIWCRWIHKCISSAKISILVNGAPTEGFSISRGLRQGCSLSPLLFNIVGEALNLMLIKATNLAIWVFS